MERDFVSKENNFLITGKVVMRKNKENALIRTSVIAIVPHRELSAWWKDSRDCIAGITCELSGRSF
jgi:hypothetical protein